MSLVVSRLVSVTDLYLFIYLGQTYSGVQKSETTSIFLIHACKILFFGFTIYTSLAHFS